MKKILIFMMVVCCWMSCSDDAKEINEKSAQEVYNDMKGNYTGYILVDNIPQKVFINIGNDFSIKQMPLKPILQHIFTNSQELNEAISSADNTTFTALTDNISILLPMAYLTMKPTDFQFTVTVNEKSYMVTAMIETTASKPLNAEQLSVNMDVIELLCNNQTYDLTTNPIRYFIDVAEKDKTE